MVIAWRRKQYNGGKVMRFSQFCDTAENTEQEQQLLQFLEKDDLKKAKNVFTKLTRVPIFGNLFAAVIAMSNYESIAAYRQSRHYEHIKDWEFDVDFDKNSMKIGPNDEQEKKAVRVVAIIGAVIALIVLCRKFCCGCRKK